MRIMRFPFMAVEDDQGLQPERPVIPLRLDGAERFTSTVCLLDSGDLNNYMDWSLAADAGLDLMSAAPITEDSHSERRLKDVQCVVEDGRGHALVVPDVPMIFVRPWRIPGFSSRLGTLGMKHMLVRISAGERWTDITESGSNDTQPAMRFNFANVPDTNGRPLGRPLIPIRLANERPWYCILDTGSPDTYIARSLADEAGVDLDDAQPTGPFHLSNHEVSGVVKSVECYIQGYTGETIKLAKIPVIFTDTWVSTQYGGLLGTKAMNSMIVTICAGHNWIGFDRH
jgi:hypothetical protein